jgi:NADH-quinone oxidoreductase subunit G
MLNQGTLTIDGQDITIGQERTVLDVARKAGIDIPTFCYHSHLSVYGACRLCLVEVEGRGIQASCSVKPEPGLKIRTQSAQIRSMRKIALELLLANHHRECPTCEKSADCRLLDLSRKLGVTQSRFATVHKPKPIDRSSKSLVRDPNKCILCGDCVRMCAEIQQVGAIDFVRRGHNVMVAPAFGKNLGDVDCVNCGQCAAVCPTGALMPTSQIEEVWKALDDPKNVVVAQIAPAVRVALGECFGLPAGTLTMGQAVTALRRIGFAKVFDTAFAADLTVLEEGTEFLARKSAGEKLPLLTSCCPAWVTFVERHEPDFVSHLSSCRSPQQMFGSVAKKTLPAELGITVDRLKVVSIMPCTAKKAEADLEKFKTEAGPDVDFVITTQELARMIERAGIRFADLTPGSLDLPMGFKSGAGVIFGKTGGVTEAVLRFAQEKLAGHRQGALEFTELHGTEGVRTAEMRIGEASLSIAVAHGLGNAKSLLKRVRSGELSVDLIEVMACPGGCVGGAGQPFATNTDAVAKRTLALCTTDRTLEIRKSQDNHLANELYRTTLGEPGSHEAHELLHTHFGHQRRGTRDGLSLTRADESAVKLEVCVGTNCHLRGSQALLRSLLKEVHERGWELAVDVEATFCFEQCDKGPTVRINDKTLTHCTLAMAKAELERAVGGDGCAAGIPSESSTRRIVPITEIRQ